MYGPNSPSASQATTHISTPTPSAGLGVGQTPSSDANMVKGNTNVQCAPLGIQGSPNSSFIDVSLFSMFAHTTVFDSLLKPEQKTSSTQEFIHIIEFLRTNIVNPLRTNGYVDANSVHQLWTLMGQDVYKSPANMTYIGMNAEDFFVPLLYYVLKCEPLLNLRYAENDIQCFSVMIQTSRIEDDFPTVQRLLDRYCAENNVKFRKMPACLVLLMPYDHDLSGYQRPLYPRIFPNRKIYIGNNMTAKEDGKSYVLELSSALTKAHGNYQSYNKSSSTQWVRFDDMAYSLPGNPYIPHVTEIHNLNQALGLYELFEQKSDIPPLMNHLFRYLRVCFYIDQSLIWNWAV